MSILSKLQSLLTAANTKTGESDTTLTDAMQTLVDGYGQGGGGLTTIASGTFTGDGERNVTFTIGPKMAKTDFYIKIKARSGTVFEGDKYKYVSLERVIFSDQGYFDLASAPSTAERNFISSLSYDYNNGSTITPKACGQPAGGMSIINPTGDVTGGSNSTFFFTKSSNEFTLTVGHNNASYAYPSGIRYDWEVVYFGSNPETDIIEIS